MGPEPAAGTSYTLGGASPGAHGRKDEAGSASVNMDWQKCTSFRGGEARMPPTFNQSIHIPSTVLGVSKELLKSVSP